MTIWK